MAAPKPGNTSKKRHARPLCRTCGDTIEVPDGWSHGPAVRRHYWAKHRDVMTRHLKGAGR
jgi:hypothetical protein